MEFSDSSAVMTLRNAVNEDEREAAATHLEVSIYGADEDTLRDIAFQLLDGLENKR
jgi:hypothetical protein